MSRRFPMLFALLIAVASGFAFLVIAIHELDYAGAHPGHYGPAKVIAWTALAGAGVSISMSLVAYSLRRQSSSVDSNG